MHSQPSLQLFNQLFSLLPHPPCPSVPSSPIPSQWPVLSLGDDLGQRTVRHQGYSEHSGQFVVEDVQDRRTGVRTRRLVFLSAPQLTQSEVKLVKGVYGSLLLCVLCVGVSGEGVWHVAVCVCVGCSLVCVCVNDEHTGRYGLCALLPWQQVKRGNPSFRIQSLWRLSITWSLLAALVS